MKYMNNDIVNRRIYRLVFMFIAGCLAVIWGCGGGGDGSGTSLQTGRFVDSPVEGLYYETPTQTGITDSQGRFFYEYGETVHFSIGGISFGETTGKSVVTPLDLVPDAADETDDTVVNMIRFLQSLDTDDYPENGITISDMVRDEAQGREIEFDCSQNEFEENIQVQAMFETLNALGAFDDERTLCDSDDAVTHFRNCLDDLDDSDDNSGDGGGGDSDSDGDSDSGGSSGGDSGG